MKLNLYSLYSKSQERFNVPFFAADENEAKAYVVNMVSSQRDPAFLMCLSDFQLYQVGEFETDTGDSSPVTAFLVHLCDDLHDSLPYPPLVKETVEKLYHPKEVQK